MTQRSATRTYCAEDTALEKWSRAAIDVPETTSSPPLQIVLREAMSLSALVEQCWEPIDGAMPRPGLCSAVVVGGISEPIAEELRELVRAIMLARDQHRSAQAGRPKPPVQRGKALLTELRRSLSFALEACNGGKRHAALARLEARHEVTSTYAALAQALDDLAGLARRHRKKLEHLPDFDLAVIDEAETVARGLREGSDPEIAGRFRQQLRTALNLRNRLLTLLLGRMSETRRAIRFVFRNHPEVVKLAGSQYQRRRRAEHRTANRAAAASAPAEAASAE